MTSDAPEMSGRTPTPRPCASRRGFTLVEAIATISILAALGTVASTLVLSATTAWRDAAVAAQLHDELSSALERITKELRSIGRDGTAPGPAPSIASLTAGSIAYDAASSLSLTGDELVFVDAGAPAVTLLAGVQAFALRAFDESDAPLPATLAGADCRSIRRIEVEITLGRQGVDHTLRTRVFLRSTMTGATP